MGLQIYKHNISGGGALKSRLAETEKFTIKLYNGSFYNKAIKFNQNFIEKLGITEFTAINDEPFTYSFSTTWEEGPGFKAGEKINGFIKSDLIKMITGNDFISIPISDQWSQKFATQGSPLTLDLKFRILPETIGSVTDKKAEKILRFLSMLCVPPFHYSLGVVKEKVEGMWKHFEQETGGKDEGGTMGDRKRRKQEKIQRENFNENWVKDYFIKEIVEPIMKGEIKLSDEDKLWKYVYNALGSASTASGLNSISKDRALALAYTYVNYALQVYNTLKTNNIDYYKHEYNADMSDEDFEKVNKLVGDKLLYKDKSDYSGAGDGWGAILGDIGSFDSKFQEWATEQLNTHVTDDNFEMSDNSLMDTTNKWARHLQDYIGVSDTWKNNPRGHFTVCVKTPDFSNDGNWEDIDWMIKSFSFKPSVQCLLPSGAPIYIEVTLSLETVMSLSNKSMYELFICKSKK